MVAAAALGDVVQQHRDVEHAPRRDLLDDRGRQRMILLELAALDRRKQADRADRMLVDRIMVVHVELHLRDDPAEVGNEAAEHAGLVHPAQHRLGLVDAGQHFHEQRVGARIVADLAIDQRGVAASRRASPPGGSRAARARRARTSRSGAPDPRGRNRPPGSTIRPRSRTKPPRRFGRRRIVGSAKRKPFLPSCSSSWARNTPVRSPTVFALRK